jgi:hypothetical protein
LYPALRKSDQSLFRTEGHLGLVFVQLLRIALNFRSLRLSERGADAREISAKTLSCQSDHCPSIARRMLAR